MIFVFPFKHKKLGKAWHLLADCSLEWSCLRRKVLTIHELFGVGTPCTFPLKFYTNNSIKAVLPPNSRLIVKWWFY